MDTDLVQVAQIRWSRQRLIVEAEGACDLVFGTPADSLLGQPLHRALGISEDRARDLDQKALDAASAVVEFVPNEAGVLRLALAWRNGNATAAITNLRHFLTGAPPLQLSAVASSLSHEMRNPLSSVKMAVQTVARNTALSERDRRRLAIANREIRTIERMLWLFSEYGREVAPTLESVPVRTLVQEAAALVEPELAERRIEVRIEGDGTARVQAEAGRVARVLSQLLLNVATGQNEESTLTVEIHPAVPSGFEVRLMDRSALSKPEDASAIFEPFSWAFSRGAGLSLAALNRLMESHGGKLSADWSSGQGTLYTLSFPG
jgi:two-component system, NtrC family, sensor histidine kinase HydH